MFIFGSDQNGNVCPIGIIVIPVLLIPVIPVMPVSVIPVLGNTIYIAYREKVISKKLCPLVKNWIIRVGYLLRL